MILRSPARSLALLMFIAVCLSFIGLGRLPLLEPDEGRNAEVAREMPLMRDWVTPHYDGLPYLDKPVVLFWMIGASFSVFGVSAWAARLPEALAGLAAVLLVWAMARRMLNNRAALMAGIILAVSPLFFGLARTVIFDMPLAALVTASLACFWFNRRGHSLLLDALAFAAMGAGALTKGPVGFLLPLLVLIAYHAAAGTLRDLKKTRWLAGCAVFLAVTMPWFIEVSLRNPGFPKYAFWDESLLRFTAGAHMHRAGGPLYYVPVYFAGFFPWSFFLIFAAWQRRKSWRKLRDREHEAELFLLIWAAVIFVFFSVSHSKLPAYVLPAIPPLSILTARAWEKTNFRQASAEHLQAGAPPERRSLKWIAAGFAAMVVAGAALAGAGEWVHSLPPTAKALSHIPPSAARLLPTSLFHGAVILAALGVLGWRWSRRSSGVSWPAFASAALTLPFLALAWATPLAAYARGNSSRELARTIVLSPERDLPVYGYYYFRTGLPFYLRRPVGLVTEDGDETTSNYITRRFSELRDAPAARISQFSGPPNLLTTGPLINGAEFQQMIGKRPFLLMARNGEVARLVSGGRMIPLWTGWKFSILLVPATRSGPRQRAARNVAFQKPSGF